MQMCGVLGEMGVVVLQFIVGDVNSTERFLFVPTASQNMVFDQKYRRSVLSIKAVRTENSNND